VHLARSGEPGSSASVALATSAEIARAESISPKYLEGIMTQLKAKGIVMAERGKGGGYRLARDARDILMIDIVEALEGEVRPVDCVENSSCCVQGDACLPRKFWIGLKGAIDTYLSSKTLRDVLES
jgi:Rrf2 family protein